MQQLGSAVLDVLLGEYIQGLDQRQLELDQAGVIYAKLDSVSIYPPESDKRIYDFGADTIEAADKAAK